MPKSIAAAAKRSRSKVVGTWRYAPRRVVLEFPTIEDTRMFLEAVEGKKAKPRKQHPEVD